MLLVAVLAASLLAFVIYVGLGCFVVALLTSDLRERELNTAKVRTLVALFWPAILLGMVPYMLVNFIINGGD